MDDIEKLHAIANSTDRAGVDQSDESSVERLAVVVELGSRSRCPGADDGEVALPDARLEYAKFILEVHVLEERPALS